MTTVNHDQANLLLRLFELRRDPRLRQARTWFITHFHFKSLNEMNQALKPGSEEHTSLRMVTSYWEMAAGMVDRGLIEDEFFFESNGEMWIVWDRMREIVPELRAFYKNPSAFAHLEAACTRFEAWREKIAPGSTAVLRQLLEQATRQAAKAASE
jgi:hypothetical protein